MDKPKICVWGDSIAKGVVFDEQRGRYVICRDNCLARMARELGCDVENFAVMGNTSQQGLERMEKQELEPGALAVIEFGGNDCDLDWKGTSENPDVPQYGKVPLEKFGENLRAMVEKVRAAGMRPILVTPPPLVAQRYFAWVSKNLNPKRVLDYLGDVEHIYRWQERYALLVRSVAREMNIALVDVRDLFLAHPRMTDLICADGIHPNEKGHAMMFEGLKDAVSNLA